MWWIVTSSFSFSIFSLLFFCSFLSRSHFRSFLYNWDFPSLFSFRVTLIFFNTVPFFTLFNYYCACMKHLHGSAWLRSTQLLLFTLHWIFNKFFISFLLVLQHSGSGIVATHTYPLFLCIFGTLFSLSFIPLEHRYSTRSNLNASHTNCYFYFLFFFFW